MLRQLKWRKPDKLADIWNECIEWVSVNWKETFFLGTLMFLTKEAVRLALDGVAVGVACDGCPPLPDLMERYEAAGGRYYVCPICFDAKKLDKAALIAGAELQGTAPMWQWIGDEGATTFSY